MPTVDKVIVTNLSALLAKYGSRSRAIRSAIVAMVAADKKRGVATKLIPIDDAVSMKPVGGKPVSSASDERGAKAAIDAICKKLQPDYVLILGANDVVPHQTLENPVPHVGEDADPDPNVPSDLPYACDVPYSSKPRDFRGPTRVVGRLPDINGGTDPLYLVALMKRAMSYKSRPASDYASYFGATASVWRESTALSLRNIFGSDADLQKVPPKTSKWPKSLLQRRSHFINCHGADTDPQFYGQSGERYPVALRANYLPGMISEGSVIAAECCYGAQLYAPGDGGQEGICNTYLAEGAYGYFGSSTVAYGPSEGNGEADLVCQYFLQQILLGASLGRAALEARQKFVQMLPSLSPTNLKTLIQFSLMGDPSVHPVLAAKPALLRTKAYKAVLGKDKGEHNARRLRRDRLFRNGEVLQETVAAAKAVTRKPTGKVRTTLANAAHEAGVGELHWASYDSTGGTAMTKRGKGIGAGKTRFDLAIGRAVDHEPSGVVKRVVLLATSRDGQILTLRRLHSR